MGLLHVTQAVLPAMLERGKGHIINIGSVAGRGAYAGGTVYCASKSAVKAISEGLKHGYFLWDIQSKDDWEVDFVELINPKPFVTLPWQGTVQKTIEVDLSKFPVGTRYRIKGDGQITQRDSQSLLDLLRNEYGASEVTFKIGSSDTTHSSKISSDGKLVKDDLRNPDVITRLVRDYHSNINISTDEWTKVDVIVADLLKKVSSSEEVARNSNWSVRQLKFDNLYTYGPGNQIDFEKLSGVTGIFGPNRSGKSSIPGTLMYALFNSSDRGSIKNQYICNVRHSHCYARAVINVNGTDDYVIERQTVKQERKDVESASTHLNLWKVEKDGSLHDLCGEDRNETEKVLRKLIGTPEDFLLTSMSSQGDSDAYIKHGSTRRWQVLAKFLDLDVFGKMLDYIKDDLKEHKGMLKNFPEKNWTQIRSSLVEKISSYRKSLEEKSDEIVELELEINKLQHQFSKFSDFTPVTEEHVSILERKVSDLKATIKTDGVRIDALLEQEQDAKEKIAKILALEAQCNVDELKLKMKELQSLKERVLDLKHKHSAENGSLLEQKKKIKILTTVPCGEEFPTCRFIKDAIEAKTAIPEQELKVDELLELLEESQKQLERISVENTEDLLDRLSKLKDKKQKLEVQIVKFENEIEKLTASIKTNREILSQTEKKLSESKIALLNNDNVQAMTIKVELDNLNKMRASLNAEKLQIATSIGRFDSELSKIESEKSKRDEILTEMRVLELLNSAFSRKGIPRTIIATQLPLINDEITKILAGITNYTVEFENDDDSDKLELYLNYGDSRRIIELGSGMEKMISSMAIRVALSNVSSLPRSDMFIIDEGFGALDDANLEACSRMLKLLVEHYRTVLVISHVDVIKDSVDNMIEITKNEKDSIVVYN
jgi:DNA repair exonuclease SbcCD ATPase subunit